MPKQITTLSIFLASPSDVNDERVKVKKVIDELNITALKPLNMQFELINWENSTYPSFGSYPQEVINNQIDDYDIFMGILWARFGTPTLKTMSGTLEEFERAYARIHKNDLEICIYFKTDPVDPYKIDISQFQKVKDFKDSLSKLGGYHWDFLSQNFEATLRQHLLKISQTWNQRSEKKVQQIEQSIIDTDDEDEGFYELFEDINTLFQQVTADLTSYNDLTLSHNAILNHYTKKLDENPNDFKARKKIIDDTSEHMIDFSKKSKVKFNLIESNFDKAFYKFDKFLKIYPDIHNADNAKELEIMLKAFDHTIVAIPIMAQGNKSFLNAIKELPKMTTNLNRSKKLMISTLEPFIQYIDGLESKFISLQKKGFDLLSSLSMNS